MRHTHTRGTMGILGCAVTFLVLLVAAHAHSHAHSHEHEHAHAPADSSETCAAGGCSEHHGSESVQPTNDHEHAHVHSESCNHGHKHGHDAAPSEPTTGHAHANAHHAKESDHGHSHGHAPKNGQSHGHAPAKPSGHSHGHAHHEEEINAHGHAHAKDAMGHSDWNGADDHTHAHGATFDIDAFGRGKLWGVALMASLLVSCASLVCLMLLPVLGMVNGKGASSKPSEGLVNILSAFAVGAMLGDAFIHQLPHAFASAPAHGGHSHSHSWMDPIKDQAVALSCLAGILVFFLVEKIIIQYGDSAGGHGHSHGHSHGAQTKACDGPQLKTAGWLNLFADAVHNFTDGMAIGASFVSGGPVAGWSKTLFILAHELPQEVGDYGVLISSGFGSVQALGFNFLSALVALAGTVVALAVGTSSAKGSGVVEGFTAGGFIYISVAGVIPMMHANKEDSTFTQVVSMVGGVAVCVAIHASGGCSHSH